MKKTLVTVLLGLLLGFIGARVLFVGSWLTLIPWSVAGLVIGFVCSKNESLINGVAYGFVLSLSFLISGYSGRPPLLSRIPFFLVLGAFGAICGVVIALAGHFARVKMMTRSPQKHQST